MTASRDIERVPMPRRLLLLLALLPGTAPALDFFLIREPVYALVGTELFTGEGRARVDRSGVLAVRSTLDPMLHCVGRFAFTSRSAGEAELHCSDGVAARLAFESLGLTSGHGRGTTPRGPASFTFGLSPEKAAPWLDIPPGKRMVKSATGVRLEDF